MDLDLAMGEIFAEIHLEAWNFLKIPVIEGGYVYNIVIILPCYSIDRSVTFFFHENNLDEVIFWGLFDPVLAGVVALCRSPYKQREPARP